ncbi:MAG: hypothetical protein COV48_03200, partial [Elusimicrobia bacterium CG11_big_fil_rev_8_21_14_0_20_64_6]
MSRSAFLAAGLLLALTACRKPAPPAPASPHAIGAELATFKQVLMPLTDETLENLRRAILLHGPESVTLTSFRQTYSHGTTTVNGAKASVLIAYSDPWRAPKGIFLQPMSVLQYLRAFANDAGTDLTMLSTPKGEIFFTREQLSEVSTAASEAGAGGEDLPFVLIRGSGH